MEFLNIKKMILLGVVFTTIFSCGEQTIVETIKVKVDTFISSQDSTNHSELDYLNLSKTASLEERIIFRIPTNNDNEDDLAKNCLDPNNLCSIFLMPIVLLVKILTNCTDAIMTAGNLTSAILIFNTNDSSTIAAGKLNLALLSKPWWHTVDWNKAHPFSSQGKWKTPGGDIDTGVTFSTNCTALSTGSCAAGEIKFDVTNYFKTLISNPNTTHYGAVIYPNANIAKSSVYSVQSNSALSPRIIAHYTGACSALTGVQTKVFYLNERLNY